MVIYLAHSTGFDFQKEFYEKIELCEGSEEHQFIFPHETSQAQFNSRELFESRQCDLVLAECSYPSTGLGIELGYATLLDIPIVIIHQIDAKISGALSTITKNIYSYTELSKINLKDLLSTVKLQPGALH